MRIIWARKNDTSPGNIRTACNFLCMKCQDIFNSPQGIAWHLKNKHGEKPQFHKNWYPTMKLTYNNGVMGRVLNEVKKNE